MGDRQVEECTAAGTFRVPGLIHGDLEPAPHLEGFHRLLQAESLLEVGRPLGVGPEESERIRAELEDPQGGVVAILYGGRAESRDLSSEGVPLHPGEWRAGGEGGR